MDNIKKIGIIINSIYAYGGEERVVTLIANEWAKKYDLTIYTFESRAAEGQVNDYGLSDSITVKRVAYPFGRFTASALSIYRFYIGQIPKWINNRAYYPKKHIQEWIDRINDDEIDVLVAVSGLNSFLVGRFADKIKAKTIAWEHSSYEGYFHPKTGFYRGREAEYGQYVGKLDKIILLNKDSLEKWEKNTGVKAQVLHNPISFKSDEVVNPDAKCIVACGRLETEKAYNDLIDIFNRFQNKHSDWKLMIVGGGRLQGELQQQIDELGIFDRVTITGYSNDVKKELLKGSVFAMTSRWEGFPMTVIEAYEVGLPVVAYDIPAIKESVIDGYNGAWVPAFDSEAFVAKLSEIADNQELLDTMSSNAKSEAKKYSIENILAEWDRVFEELFFC